MKVYISGNITGDPDCKKKFKKAEDFLKSLGVDVVNPAEVEEGLPWEEYMRRVIGLLVKCDALYLIPDCSGSKGDVLERIIADALEMLIIRKAQ